MPEPSLPSSLFLEHQSSPQGLTDAEVEKRLVFYGPNEIKEKKKTPYIIQFLEEFKDLMVIILIIASILALLMGEAADALIILFIVVLNAFIGFLQKFKAEKAIAALKKMMAQQTKVLRENQIRKILASQVVPGDILILEEGDHISADSILFEVNEVETQEAILTGESTAVGKTAYSDSAPSQKPAEGLKIIGRREDMIFMGTTITHGTGKAIAIKTGMNSEMGKIATLTDETKKDQSPLQRELHFIGIFVGKLALVIAVILCVHGIIFQQGRIISTLLFAISVAVAAVPEGLPATITIALAIGVQRLAKNNAIIKQLASIETLGATTVICSDKTGTLTKNEMTVKELYFDQYHANISGVGYNPNGFLQVEKHGEVPVIIGQLLDHESTSSQPLEKLTTTSAYKTLEILLLTAGFCNNASLSEEKNHWNPVGDPTEAALITLIKKSVFDFENIKNDYEKLHEYPFDSVRKCMTVLMRKKSSGKIFAFSKGAPSNILNKCDHISINQHPIKFDPRTRSEILTRNEQMAGNALRVLAFAYKEFSIHEQKMWEKQKIFTKEEVEKNLTFLGLTGMIDPPRPEVKEAIALCKKAGIRIYVITGDSGLTAKAIATNLGLMSEKNDLVLSGEELEHMSDAELKNLLSAKKLDIIFARVNPAHKLHIVSLLKDLGEIVAVTGDGVNDAPALKRADIGIAMGSGTDVSKEAANMILADDSFSTIVKAIQEGRTIYDNLTKFIFYVFSSNIGELVLIFGAIIFNLPMPLATLLILFINLTTDVLPAIALGVEPSNLEVMEKPPRHPQTKILHRQFLKRMVYVGGIVGLISFLGYIWDLNRLGFSQGNSSAYIKASSLAFMLLVAIELANALNARSDRQSIFKLNFFSNPKLLWGITFSIILSLMIIEIPLFSKYFHTAPLDWQEWLVVFLCSVFIIAVEEIRKFFVRKKSAPFLKTLKI